jgi:hypothetical protein
MQPIRVNEEVALVAWEFYRNVIEYELTPSQMIKNSIHGSEIFSQALFSLCHGHSLVSLLTD